MDTILGLVLIVVIVGVCTALYMLPAIVAYERKHHQRMAILVLNFFLGWTFLGWIGSLVWAMTHTSKTSEVS